VRHASLRTARALPMDVLVNATPAGMTPHTEESPYSGRIRRGMIVFDAVYTPPRTRLLEEAANPRSHQLMVVDEKDSDHGFDDRRYLQADTRSPQGGRIFWRRVSPLNNHPHPSRTVLIPA